MTNSFCLLTFAFGRTGACTEPCRSGREQGNGAGTICIPLLLLAAVLFCPFLASYAVSQRRSGSAVLLLGCGDGGPPPCLGVLKPVPLGGRAEIVPRREHLFWMLKAPGCTLLLVQYKTSKMSLFQNDAKHQGCKAEALPLNHLPLPGNREDGVGVSCSSSTLAHVWQRGCCLRCPLRCPLQACRAARSPPLVSTPCMCMSHSFLSL